MSSIYYKGQKYTGPTLDLGSGSLTTDNKTIVGAINELDARMDAVQKTSTSAISSFGHVAIRVGDIKVIHFLAPTSAMTYNTAYTCPIVDSDFYPTKGEDVQMVCNGRNYTVTISTGNVVKITPLSNTLPADGKPYLNATFVYI